jgi:hypothetical protein
MKEPKKNTSAKAAPEENKSSAAGLTDNKPQDDLQEIKTAAEYTINFSDLKDKDLFDEYNPWS